MATVRLPINEIPYQNVDSSELEKFSDALINGYINEAGHGVGRPCLKYFTDLDLTEAIDGLFWWEEEQFLIAVCDSNVYKVDSAGSKTLLGSGAMVIDKKVSFVNSYVLSENKNYLFMANGGKIYYTDGTGLTAMADANAPQYCSWLSSLNTYLLANDDVDKDFRWADPGDPFTWDPTNGIRPDVQGDEMTALILNKDRINLFGERTLEVYYNSGDTIPFTKIQGSTQSFGCLATQTIYTFDNQIIFLDNNRRVVLLQGGSVTILSVAIDKLVQAIPDVSNATGVVVNSTGRNFYILTFPTVRKCYVFDFDKKCWYDWATWNAKGANYDMFPVADYTYARTWNKRLIGSKDGSVIYELTPDVYQDDGSTRRVTTRTGHYDHNTYDVKRSLRLTVKVKRGFSNIEYEYLEDPDGKPMHDQDGDLLRPPGHDIAGMDANATLLIRWRNDGAPSWSNWREVGLRNNGNSEFLARLYALGSYRTRQYEIVYRGATPYILMGIEEIVLGAKES